MTTIVKRSVFAVMQGLPGNTTELSDASWRCPITRPPIATLRLAVVFPHRRKGHGIGNLRSSNTTAFLALTVVFLLAAAGTFVVTIYLSGLLMQRIQHLQRYHEPRARYSDVWNWRGRT